MDLFTICVHQPVGDNYILPYFHFSLTSYKMTTLLFHVLNTVIKIWLCYNFCPNFFQFILLLSWQDTLLLVPYSLWFITWNWNSPSYKDYYNKPTSGLSDFISLFCGKLLLISTCSGLLNVPCTRRSCHDVCTFHCVVFTPACSIYLLRLQISSPFCFLMAPHHIHLSFFWVAMLLTSCNTHNSWLYIIWYMIVHGFMFKDSFFQR